MGVQQGGVVGGAQSLAAEWVAPTSVCRGERRAALLKNNEDIQRKNQKVKGLVFQRVT